METTVKKREWVKDAAILFLAVLLVLTFFSNTIMNRSLPEVATAAVQSGNIIAKVRGTGTVTATGKHQVKAKETRTIRSVMVKVGQEVNVGDVLFVLGQGDETLLEQAKEKLRTLQASYQRAALNVPTMNYASYNRAIENAQNALNRAMDKRYEAETKLYDTTADPITAAALQRYLDQEEYVRQLELEYTVEKDRKLEELANRKAQLEQEIANLEISSEYLNRQAAVDEAQRQYDSVSGQASAYESEMQNAQQLYEITRDNPAATDDEINAYYNAYIDAINNYNSAQSDLSNLESTLNDAISYRDQLVVDYQNDLSNIDAQIAALDDSAHYAVVKAAMEKRDTYYNEYTILAGGLESDYQEALYAEEDARVALQAAYDDLAYAQEQNAQSIASVGVDMNELAEQIAVQQEKIKSLAGDEENVITANVSGTIDTIDCTAGDTVLKDALLCTMEVPDMGHTLSFSVTNDQAQRLRIGDTATISNYYWGNSVTATLTTIRTDPKNPQSNKILTFDLEGDVTSGAEMTISVGQKSASYDIIVPNSAIKSDANGSFVLAVAVKSSPLGNRYTARRVSVEVLASDDNNSAIVADLANGDYVITTSSAPVASGDMVRIADNQT